MGQVGLMVTFGVSPVVGLVCVSTLLTTTGWSAWLCLPPGVAAMTLTVVLAFRCSRALLGYKKRVVEKHNLELRVRRLEQERSRAPHQGRPADHRSLGD